MIGITAVLAGFVAVATVGEREQLAGAALVGSWGGWAVVAVLLDGGVITPLGLTILARLIKPFQARPGWGPP
jgi:hypothetical protein